MVDHLYSYLTWQLVTLPVYLHDLMIKHSLTFF